jgi:hypothetical protein
MSQSVEIFPPLPLDEWKETKNTLHLFVQIIGKIRLALFPPVNHWWHASLYVSPHGLTTHAIPYNYGSFEILIDLLNHKLIISTSSGNQKSFSLHDGLSVSEFYNIIFEILSEMGIYAKIIPIPYGTFTKEPFASDKIHSSYNKQHIEKFRNILTVTDGILKKFRGRFNGKSTPVHLFWHSFDLALTRFSGKTAPLRENMGKVDKEAYSHEVISFGFWFGDNDTPAPSFYSYTAPEPEGLSGEPLQPEEAYWRSLSGSSLALLMYDDVRKADNTEKLVLDFLESAYLAGAKLAGWDVKQFKASIVKQY